MANVEWHGEEILQKARAAAKEAIHLGAEIVLNKWQETIPYASGELASTLTVNDTDEGSTVSSSGPHAAKQEFDASLRHPDPTNPLSLGDRKAHAGRDALEESKDQIAELVAAKIEAALK